jgi:hypothetical protein
LMPRGEVRRQRAFRCAYARVAEIAAGVAHGRMLPMGGTASRPCRRRSAPRARADQTKRRRSVSHERQLRSSCHKGGRSHVVSRCRYASPDRIRSIARVTYDCFGRALVATTCGPRATIALPPVAPAWRGSSERASRRGPAARSLGFRNAIHVQEASDWCGVVTARLGHQRAFRVEFLPIARRESWTVIVRRRRPAVATRSASIGPIAPPGIAAYTRSAMREFSWPKTTSMRCGSVPCWRSHVL